ncbi:MAG: OmpA family protein [Pirellulaceae bacterium]|nr:OmpA family protein [Pirellulaceae bacterium]
MAEEEDDAGGIPEWVVTFGDMMSLLLTFFIMLVSLSEIKEEEKFQAIVESMRRQFGHVESMSSVVPGESKPRNSRLAKIATQGRARRKDTMRGGNKVPAPVGENRQVRIIRPGNQTAVGSVIFFQDDQVELSDANKEALRNLVKEIGGKPQKIEVRGHTSRKPVEDDSAYEDNWGLAFTRSRNVMHFITEGLEERNINPKRVRMSVAGPNEPIYLGADLEKMKQNSRVEVFILEELYDDLIGTEDQQKALISTEIK